MKVNRLLLDLCSLAGCHAVLGLSDLMGLKYLNYSYYYPFCSSMSAKLPCAAKVNVFIKTYNPINCDNRIVFYLEGSDCYYGSLDDRKALVIPGQTVVSGYLLMSFELEGTLCFEFNIQLDRAPKPISPHLLHTNLCE